MDTTPTTNGTDSAGRVDWVDYAKGICIVMVVMMHSVLGVEAAAGQTGFMHLVVAFAKPFRMPDFFLISGLFLAVVIDRDWRTYLDRKVMHFAYFYVLWVAVLLIHREMRDEEKCAKKYGADWERYKKAVPWRIVPYLY